MFKSLSRTMCFKHGALILGLMLFATAAALKTNRRGLRATDPCTETKRALQLSGLKGPIPHTAVNGRALQVCPREYSCCTHEVEANLITRSNLDFEIEVERKCSLVEHMFSNKSAKVDEFFQKLVDNAKDSLDDLFHRTYGSLYVDNSAIFMELFDNLKTYYHGQGMPMEEIFDKFFSLLVQKVFKLMNAKYVIDDKYMQCIGDSVNSDVLQPYEDTPEKLSSSIQKAFVTARSFIRGLEVGKELAYNVAKFDPTQDCTKAFMKMSYCSKCQGIASIKPCNGLCLNIMKGCLHDYNRLDAVWNEYIDAMQKILDRLDGHHNIESVLQPFAIRISEAIMTLQEKGAKLKSTIFTLCGTPPKVNTSDTDDMSFLGLESMGSIPLPPSYQWPDPVPGVNPSPVELESLFPGSVKRAKGQVEFDLTATRERRSLDENHGSSKKSKRGRRGGKRRHHKKNKEELQLYHQFPVSYDPSEYDGYTDSSYEVPRTNLKMVVTEMRITLEATKDHWRNLPHAVCEDVAAPASSHSCWNGESEGIYTSPTVEEGSENPEIIGQIPDQVIETQTDAMRQIIGQLKNVYNERNRFPIDDEITDSSGDYSGSGDGSGDQPGADERNNGDDRQPSEVSKCPTCGATIPRSFWPLAVLSSIALWILRPN